MGLSCKSYKYKLSSALYSTHNKPMRITTATTITRPVTQLPLCQPQKDDVTTGLPRRLHRLKAIGNQIRYVPGPALIRGCYKRCRSCLYHFPARFLRRLQKSIQRRVSHCSDSEEMMAMDPLDKVTSPLLAKSPSLPIKFQKSQSTTTQFKVNRQPKVGGTHQYHSLDTHSSTQNMWAPTLDVD